jgi:hypothetical protein
MNDVLDFDEYCIISEKDFKDLNNLYKFIPVKQGNVDYFYNKKRNCYVIKKTTDKLLKNSLYLLNKSWFKTELYATNCEILQKIGEFTPELYLINKSYKEMREKEKHSFGSLTDFVGGALNELLAMDKT